MDNLDTWGETCASSGAADPTGRSRREPAVDRRHNENADGRYEDWETKRALGEMASDLGSCDSQASSKHERAEDLLQDTHRSFHTPATVNPAKVGWCSGGG
jgi:hypothetical protein